MSVEEDNKAICRRRTEAISTGDLDTIDELMVPNLAQDVKERIVEIRQTFPDYHATIMLQVAEGDYVASRFVARGTHLGELEGLSPTGEQYTFEGLAIDRVVDGKIVGFWADYNIWPYELTDRLIAQEERKRELIEQELRVARSIQQASLPATVPTLEGWEITPQYLPAREVGGDFYDFFELEDGRVGVVVGTPRVKECPRH